MTRLIIATSLLFAGCAYAIEYPHQPVGLAKVKRIYVEQMGGGRESDQMRDMIIAALQNSGLFTITEDPAKADASLRGSSDDKIYVEQHHTTDSIGVHANSGGGSSSAARLGNSSASHGSAGIGISQNETSNIQDRRHEAVASVRLVDEDGDVIWSTTQESTGGKFRAALPDIADRISRKLVEDTKKARASR